MNNFEQTLNELFGFGKKEPKKEWTPGGQADEWYYNHSKNFGFTYVQLSWLEQKKDDDGFMGRPQRTYTQKFLWWANYGSNFEKHEYFKTFSALQKWAMTKLNIIVPSDRNDEMIKSTGRHEFGSTHQTKKDAMKDYKKAK